MGQVEQAVAEQQRQQQQAENREATHNTLESEVQKYLDADPEFKRVYKTRAWDVMDMLAAALPGGYAAINSPEVAQQYATASYEATMTLRKAEQEAELDLPFLEREHLQKLAEDRTGTLGPFDPEKARAEAISARLAKMGEVKMGSVAASRQRHRAGLSPGNHLERGLKGIDAMIEGGEPARRDAEDSLLAAERAKLAKPPGWLR
jgi:hypothetical protein